MNVVISKPIAVSNMTDLKTLFTNTIQEQSAGPSGFNPSISRVLMTREPVPDSYQAANIKRITLAGSVTLTTVIVSLTTK